jgi:CheY-like chemotaxis protein
MRQNKKMGNLSEETPLATDETKKKILIMDDEDMVGEIACQMLEYLGFEAVRVTDGADAVNEYKKHLDDGMPFFAVIMDLTIPGGMGGEEAVAGILEIDRDAKVFVSSGYSTDPIMVDPQAYGFAGGIAKPFDLAAMQKILSSIV